MDLIDKTKVFVKEELANNDASHDWYHIERVMKLAETIASKEENVDLEVVKLAALLHDVADWKYSGSETAGVEKARAWLEENQVDEAKIKQIVNVIENVGFKNELGGKKEMSLECRIVQDADRLDAIGAIGIARCLTYGGAKNRVLHITGRVTKTDISKEEYTSQRESTTLDHFYEKLLKLRDMMKTKTGREMATTRHEFMEKYLEQFHLEWEGLA